MKILKDLIPAVIAALVLASACTDRSAIDNMKCEYLTDPICIDTPDPHFSWNYTEAAGTDFVEAGYKIEIAENESELGKAATPSLKPLTSYVWRVTAWNADSSKVLVSPTARFETAMFSYGDWKARWITDSLEKDEERAPMLRKEFHVNPGLVQARLYVSAAAYGEIFLNGERASESRLDPGYTTYDKRNLYAVHDVSSLVHEGDNCIGAVLGNGFYNEIKPVAMWEFEKAAWRGRARLLAELHLSYKDGSREVVSSDNSWKTTAEGPYLRNNIYAGDSYDARKELPGWNRAGYDDSAWGDAVEVPGPSEVLTAQKQPPIEAVEMLAPVDVRNWGDTVFVLDFGRNIAGVCEICTRGEAGTKLSIRHAEMLKEDGTIDQSNVNGPFHPQEGYEFQTDFYYLKGDGREVWRPSFTYHGFRYAEIKADRPLVLDTSLTRAVVMHNNVAPACSFSCSNDLLNRIWDIAGITYLNNLYSIFTDCPQREKNGWTADNFLTTELALLSFDTEPYFINKWADDVIDNILEDGRVSSIMPDWGIGYGGWAGPVWDSSIFTIAEQVYDYTGDLSIIRKLWPVYKRYLDFIQTKEGDDGYPTYGLGDWLPYKTETPSEFTTPCFYFKDWSVMARFAQAMGEDPSPYREKAEKIRVRINEKWFDTETKQYANGSQTAQSVALYLGIAPENEAAAVAGKLAGTVEDNDSYLDFGCIGSKTVPRMLTRYGYAQAAYEMASKEEYPSWGWWLKKGMTTLCEAWDMGGSLDHAFLGDIAAWYVNCIVGINPDPEDPGFKNILMTPHFPEGLDWAQASYRSVRGTVRSSWKRTAEGIELEIDIPIGSTASLSTEYGEQSLKAGHNRILYK